MSTKRAIQKRRMTEKKPSRLTGKTLLLGSLAVLLVIAAILTATLLPGALRRKGTVASTSHFKVNGRMYSYFFYNSVEQQLTGSYQQVYAYYGITLDSNLKKIAYDEKQSWFDFFEETAAQRLETILCYAESGVRSGLQVNGEMREQIDAAITDLQQKATAAGIKWEKYLDQRYGKGVREEDLRSMMEIQLLADARSGQLADGIQVEDSEITEYSVKNPDKLLMADLCFYLLEPKKNATDADKAALKARADELAERTDLESFSTWVRAYEDGLSLDAGGEILTDSEWSEVYADLLYEDLDYDTVIRLDEDYASRKIGETTVMVDEKTGSCGVLLVLSELHMDETTGYNLQFAAFSSEKNAKEALADCQSGKYDPDPREAFSLACTEHGATVNRVEHTALKNVVISEEGADWVRETPKEGEIKMFLDGKIVYLVRYDGEGYCGWQRSAWLALRSSKYADLEKALLKEEESSVSLVKRTAAAISDRG